MKRPSSFSRIFASVLSFSRELRIWARERFSIFLLEEGETTTTIAAVDRPESALTSVFFFLSLHFTDKAFLKAGFGPEDHSLPQKQL